ncbi:exodeoxyribonuclease VII large subunit [Patescibacteria group bacterium]|nr:exodeoxyribonuclease VII large subunit [Patescibacteria group bacterium]
MEKDYSNRILTVSEYLELLNEYLKPLNFSVSGEVSSVSDRAGNSVFFTVSDEKEPAKLECVMWRFQYRNLGFKLEPGMKIQMSGASNIYKPSGKLSYVASNIILTGEGALQKAFEELKEKLRNEGLFSQERKRALPAYPKTIGLITADNSDAKKDFETHLGNYGFKIYFYDVRVEGLKSAENVVQAIKYFNENFTDVDILTITRGGGSLESLQAFNSEGVARAVFSSRIPVVSAIGHERNFTICDMVADVRASTPTDAGKIVSKDWREASQILSQAKKDIFSAYNIALISYREYLDLQAERMSRAFKASVGATRNKIKNVGANILRESEHLINQNKQKLEYLGRVLDAMNPEKKLQQGYAIVRTLSGKVVRSANSVDEGDIIKTQFFDGNIESKVKAKS